MDSRSERVCRLLVSTRRSPLTTGEGQGQRGIGHWYIRYRDGTVQVACTSGDDDDRARCVSPWFWLPWRAQSVVVAHDSVALPFCLLWKMWRTRQTSLAICCGKCGERDRRLWRPDLMGVGGWNLRCAQAARRRPLTAPKGHPRGRRRGVLARLAGAQ